MTPGPRLISFIIPAHNEEPLLGATLDALQAAAPSLDGPFEIIVVDDGSTDRTAAIARGRGIRVVSVGVRQISAARNAGARVACGDVLMFVDADTLVGRDVLTSAMAALRGGAVGGGAAVVWDGPLPFWARALASLTLWTMRVGTLAAGCFVFCTRAAFDEVGGFDETLYATEEIWLSRALKRVGRFVLLRESVTTSGRKLRTYSGLEIAAMSTALLYRGLGAFRDRRSLALWYGDRRHDRWSGRGRV